MTKSESAIQWMEKTAADPSHGYDQQYRWGERGDYDCSSAVCMAWEQAGVKVREAGASYTGNMKNAFIKCGFKDVTKSVNLATGAGLQRSDVLLNESHHVAMYCGNGKEVEASINEKGKTTGGIPGNQNGKEFLVRAYRNYPWNVVLRYSDSTATAPAAPEPIVEGKDKKYAKKYVCTTDVCLHRTPDINTGSVINVLPEGRSVQCWGFYKNIPGRTMLCIMDLKTGKEGWISMKCLKEA